jgi:hypothetical protein
MTLREQILNANDRREEKIGVPEWGNAELLIIGQTAATRARWLQTAVVDGKLDFSRVYADLVIACAHDPETRLPVFEETDRDALNQKSGAALELVAQAAIRVNALSATAIDVAEKNS